jgi:hypothetical protein
MTEVQKADPAARRHAVLLIVVSTLLGAALIVGFERYRTPLRDWFLSKPEKLALRLRLLFLLCAAFVSVPLFGIAVYLWSFGGKVVRARRFPPPGHRVIRDTPILKRQAALSRGRSLKVLAGCIAVAGALLWFLLWPLASVLGASAG